MIFSQLETNTSTSMAAAPSSKRPLSPHLQIYRFTLTMAASVLHRLTGIILYAGTAALALFLFCIATDGKHSLAFAVVDSFLGALFLFGYAWAFLTHALGGIRHLIWDTGRCLTPKTREVLPVISIFGGFVLTIIIWAFAL